MLYQLKRAGIIHLDLVTVYISVVRPVLEYTCPVWHNNLPKYLWDSIELIQTRALKSIFPGKSYNDILNDIGLRTLRERREVLCIKYFTEIQGSAHTLNGLLPALYRHAISCVLRGDGARRLLVVVFVLNVTYTPYAKIISLLMLGIIWKERKNL